MPIYEYKCPKCDATFEELVRSTGAGDQVACPNCGHREVVRQPSVFTAHAAQARRWPPAGGCGSCCGPDGSCPLALDRPRASQGLPE